MTHANVNKNATYNMIRNICGIIFPLITFPYISRVLGPENAGKINFSSSIVSYFSLGASLGISVYAIRECSKLRDNRSDLSLLSSQIFSINVISTLISYLGLVILLLFATPLNSYRYLIMIQSMSILFTTLGTEWINTAMSDFRFITIRYVIVQIISLGLILMFVRRRDDYYIYAIIGVFATCGAGIANILYRRKYCDIRFVKDADWRRHLPNIFIMFFMLVAQTIFVNTDSTILGLVCGDYDVGVYGAATKIYTMVNTTIASVAWVVMPRLSELFANKNYSEINGLLRYTLNIIIVLGVPSVIGINVLAKELILLLAGKEYVGAAASLHILTISLAFSLIGGFIGNIIMLPSGKEFIMMISCVVGAIINLVLNLFLIPKYGISAAATTTTIANAIGVFICLPYIDKEIKIEKIWKMLYPAFIGGGLIVLMVLMVKQVTLNTLFTVIISLILSIVVYLMVMIKSKDEFVMTYLGQMKGKLRSIKK